MSPVAAPRVVTIGVYGRSREDFLDALARGGVGLVMDLRQRRGVRGPEYAWANSRRLQGALANAGIDYQHHRELAPTTELRQLQYREDDRQGVGKRSRVELAAAYRDGYTREVLERVDLGEVVARMPMDAATALLCVERDAAACHRSLVAARLEQELGIEVKHL
jgi:uncharacterized protein (DUF488 family)